MRLEVFFDYACPYCLRAHDVLTALLPSYPQIEVVWRPCESHPRPDRYGPHSDLCIKGMFFAEEQGADLGEYHRLCYLATLVDRIDIEDIDTLAGYVGSLLDQNAFHKALKSRRYHEKLKESNDYAFRKSGVWVVPAYRMAGHRLDAIEDVGVTRKQLAAFLDQV